MVRQIIKKRIMAGILLVVTLSMLLPLSARADVVNEPEFFEVITGVSPMLLI